MKAKVLMYGSDGNKVVRKYVELDETDCDLWNGKITLDRNMINKIKQQIKTFDESIF